MTASTGVDTDFYMITEPVEFEQKQCESPYHVGRRHGHSASPLYYVRWEQECCRELGVVIRCKGAIDYLNTFTGYRCEICREEVDSKVLIVDGPL